MDDLENILENLVRVGTVTDVDGAGRCRVKFQDTGITSDWLAVLQRPGTQVKITPDGGHSHGISETYLSREQASHTHTADTKADHAHGGSSAEGWTPKVNSRVVCLYLPVSNGDGFVLGQL